MVQYYTLEEAARILHLPQDEAKRLAEDRKVRMFRDRGTLRFRAQDIDELARSLGLGSDPDLQLGEIPAPKKSDSPAPRRAPKTPETKEMQLNLDLDDSDQVEVGQEPPRRGPRSGRSPVPKAGSDSDVRLVNDSSELDFQVEDSPTAKPRSNAKPASGSDSDVKMVLEPDDQVPLGQGKSKTASDSDIRLEHSKPGKRTAEDTMVTEEIDLDVEMSKPTSAPSKGAPGRKAQPELPTSSPFELSSENLDKGSKSGSGRARPTQYKPATESSDEFSLNPNDVSPLELGSDEMPALPPDDEDIGLADLAVSRKPGDSGINLKEPADSGISLEGDDSDEFELSLDLPSEEIPDMVAKPKSASTKKQTPPAKSSPSKPASGKKQPPAKPAKGPAAKAPPAKKSPQDEFELSLDDEGLSGAEPADSSEFELSLDSSMSSSELEVGGMSEDSDSEFELTLDDSSGSSPLEEGGDIFETDFDVPSLDDDSGSEAVALEEGESSDFDLDLSEEDMITEDESDSQVVALDDEEADDASATVTRRRRRPAPVTEDDEDWDDLEADTGRAPAGSRVRVEYVEQQAAPWGPLPALLMIPSILVLFVIGLMGFELLTSMSAYRRGEKPASLVLEPLTEAISGEKLPGSKK